MMKMNRGEVKHFIYKTEAAASNNEGEVVSLHCGSQC